MNELLQALKESRGVPSNDHQGSFTCFEDGGLATRTHADSSDSVKNDFRFFQHPQAMRSNGTRLARGTPSPHSFRRRLIRSKESHPDAFRCYLIRSAKATPDSFKQYLIRPKARIDSFKPRVGDSCTRCPPDSLKRHLMRSARGLPPSSFPLLGCPRDTGVVDGGWCWLGRRAPKAGGGTRPPSGQGLPAVGPPKFPRPTGVP